jgi:urea carboxylase-associated protein 2
LSERPFESPPESTLRVVTDDVVPAGGYWTGVVRRGRTVRFTDVEGSGGAAVLLFNANEPSERYNAPDTVKIQNQIYLTAGMVLFSDLGRVLASVTADTSRHHDTLAGASDAASVSARHGSGPYRDLRNERFVNTHDNFIAALGRHALDRRDIVSNLNLFDRVEVDPGGAFRWVGPGGGAGASVDLRAEHAARAGPGRHLDDRSSPGLRPRRRQPRRRPPRRPEPRTSSRHREHRPPRRPPRLIAVPSPAPLSGDPE